MKMREMSDEEMECLSSFSEDRSLTGPRRSVHLWEFLLELLMDESNSTMIEWTDEVNGEFKLKNSEDVAKKWGQRKHKEGMNYDKLSRALRYYYSKDIIKKVSGRRFVYKFVASPEMQAAVNAIKTHMMRGGIKNIPVGPFPHYQHIHDDIKRQPNQDLAKPYIYHPHSRPNSVSPRLEYGRPTHPTSNSPPRRARSPHRSDPEDHHRPGSIILEHSYRGGERRGSPHIAYPTKESSYNRTDELRREEETFNERKRHHSERDHVDDERRYRYSEHGVVRHRPERIERRNSTSEYPLFRYKNTSPPPDSRLALYEENARKYAEERLKVLDRYHFGRESNMLLRRQESPGPIDRRERNGHLFPKQEDKRSLSPSTLRTHDNNNRANSYAKESRSPPPPRPHSHQGDHHSPRNDSTPSDAPAIVLSTNYLPKSVKETSPSHQPPTVDEPHCYMYRRYSPMIDASTQTVPTATDVSPPPEDHIKKEIPDKSYDIPVSRFGELHRKGWKVPSPINTRYEEDRDSYEYQNGNDNHNHHHHHNSHISREHSPSSPRSSPTTLAPSNCKCGCMETIESPTGTGTVVVYPKEIV